MIYSIDKLLAEAAEAGLYIQLVEHRYWRECHDLQWCCWVRSKTQPDMAKKGEGMTASEALNEALNAALTFNPLPEVKITGYTPSLDSILGGLPKLKPTDIKKSSTTKSFDRRGL